MGLDITAYKKAKLLKVFSDSEELEENEMEIYNAPKKTYISFYREVPFPVQFGDLKQGGVYEYESRFDFRAGSYIGYGVRRNQLSELMFNLPQSDVWANPTHEGKPFYELIYFSDCDYVICTAVCRKLAKDFADYQHVVDAYGDPDLSKMYADFRRAFELASDDGFVSFH